MIRATVPLAVLLLAAAAARPAEAALVCERHSPAVTVTVDEPPPAIDNTLTQPGLQKRAGKFNHAGHAMLGLYSAEFMVSWRTITAWQSLGSEACHWIDRVTIEIAVTHRKIYVIRARRPGTCLYDSVLGHERKHQAVDDGVVAEYRERFAQAAERAIAALPPPAPVALGEGKAAAARLTAAVEKALRASVGAMNAARDARQAAVDTPSEYRRVGAACG
jgi:hypothetical protein